MRIETLTPQVRTGEGLFMDRKHIFLPLILPLYALLCGCELRGDAVGDGPPTRSVSFETNEGTALGFDISPDGETIVFDLLGQLWTLSAAGGEAEALTDAVNDVAEDLDPSFSPCGKWIVFSGDRGGIMGVWILSTEGGEPRLVARTEQTPPVWRHARPAWSPDGKRIAFSNADRFFVHYLDSDSTAHIEFHDRQPGPLQPAWLADGRILTRVPQAGWPSNPSGRLRVIDLETGEGEDLDTGGLDVIAPALSPDGKRLAYIAEDDDGRAQVWLQTLDTAEPIQITRDEDVSPVRVRWAAEGKEVLFSARGRLWRVEVETGAPYEIPFRATVSFERDQPDLPHLRFPEPGVEMPARGHAGAALSPDGNRVALIALGKLWLWPIGDEPAPVTDVPSTAAWLGWAPDGSQVVWSAGLGGAEDLYVTRVETGETRQLTSLPGQAYRPSWSPDGAHIAFIYWPAPAFPNSEDPEDQRGHFAVISADGETVSERSNVRLLGEITNPGRWLWIPGPMVQEVPAWAPGSDALLYHPTYGPDWRVRWWRPPERAWTLLPLEGEPRPVEGVSAAVTFLQWAPYSSLVYVHANQLWRADVHGTQVGEPTRLSQDAAFYPSVARDGTILYIGEDGYRIRRTDGTIESLGWPLSYRVPTPPPLLIRGVRIISGSGVPQGELSDIFLENGRIAEIAPSGALDPDPETEVIDAGGRTLIPGLIDLHVHGSEYAVYLASLYHGVTTTREAGAPIAWMAALRDMAEAGIHPGPRVVLGGPQINPGDPNSLTGASVQNPDTIEEVERALTLVQAFGASYAKMRGPRGWAAGAGFVREAHRRGIRVSGHCAYPLPLIAAGIDHKEHGGDCRYLQQPRNDLIQLYHAAGIGMVPTLANSAVWSGRAAARAAESEFRQHDVSSFLTPALRFFGGYDRSPADVRFDHEAWRERLEDFAVLHGVGLSIASGTDEWYLPGAIHLELEELVAGGLSPAEAIIAATVTAARFLGADREIGTVEEGKRADLILLDADPLEDVRNTRQIWKVIKGGEVVDREGMIEWMRNLW